MLKVQRVDLPSELQQDLNQRQIAVDNQTMTTETAWEKFKEHETAQSKEKQPTIKQILEMMFHSKCAYCEANRGTQIEHHWPKSPHRQNYQKGTATKMFQWDNLLWPCETCNGFENKASRMEWDTQGKPQLLNPCVDEPMCYLEVYFDDKTTFKAGWLKPLPNLSLAASKRAEYTITRLGLNKYNHPTKRMNKVSLFRYFMNQLEKGADIDLVDPSRRGSISIRQHLINMLTATEFYLTPIRQILYTESDIYQLLLTHIPELEPILATWALPPGDCSNLEESHD